MASAGAPRSDAPPPDERHRDVCAAIRGGAELALPDRLSMFGHTRMPVTEIELLRAVGEVREVHLWLPQASPAAWDRLATPPRPARCGVRTTTPGGSWRTRWWRRSAATPASSSAHCRRLVPWSRQARPDRV